MKKVFHNRFRKSCWKSLYRNFLVEPFQKKFYTTVSEKVLYDGCKNKTQLIMGVVKRVVRCHVLDEVEAICTTVSETVVQKSC
jgi:hypothetical protein